MNGYLVSHELLSAGVQLAKTVNFHLVVKFHNITHAPDISELPKYKA